MSGNRWGLDAQEGPQELVGHRLEVVGPLEDRHVLRQVPLVHAPERPQEVPQPRPDPLQRVAVHLADPVAVVVPRPLARRVADRRVPAARSPAGGRSPATRRCRPSPPAASSATTSASSSRRSARSTTRSRTCPTARPTTPATGGRSLAKVPWPRPLVGPPPRRVVGVGVRDAFFPPRSGTSRRPRPPASSSGLGSAASQRRRLEPVPQPQQVLAVCAPARGPAARWGRPGRCRGGSGGSPRGGGASCGRRSR